MDVMESVASTLAISMMDKAFWLSENVSKITVSSEISLGNVLVGVLVIMLSYVFRYGEELQKQADETL